ncbi:MAG: hypothetical protein II558_02345, partial [Treponema sp.]|nr:hypothetical protein [Treponema sp.]
PQTTPQAAPQTKPQTTPHAVTAPKVTQQATPQIKKAADQSNLPPYISFLEANPKRCPDTLQKRP